MLSLEFGQLFFRRVFMCTFSHRNYPISFEELLQIDSYLGTASNIASSSRFSSLGFGYNAGRAFAKRRKTGPRSCSAWSQALKALVHPLTWMRFPVQSRHWFRSIPATQSDVIRP